MKLPSTEQQAIYDACPEFFDDLSPQIEWKWDDHFGCLLAEFSVDHAQQVYAIAKKHFPHTWNKKQLKKADPYLKHRAGFFGILEKKQELFSKDDNGQQEIMLSWWPWGHGATVSVRVFQVNQQPYEKPQGFFDKIAGIFGR
ncbi:hypothetical protein Q4574_16970 [Aliiglaciecola sp. 3_MG-2023]|uniref:hypothetical protein n=1 Tax=Aliiglaciecola sp. 3_MG-2023 TaxID=3062644 RepID=UPI0026E43AD2|nr:hypothetical protein [Aliiglaciecola sp. 3_MG-2023]MDO6694992.1 hypothetical protein [Aliiglaciecola sp. 3_MG-2023]